MSDPRQPILRTSSLNGEPSVLFSAFSLSPIGL